jgi:CTP synthase
VGDDIKKKIALFGNVNEDSVIENVNTSLLYEAPLMFERQKFCEIVLNHLGVDAGPPDMSEWEAMIDRVAKRDKEVTIALVGKYTKLHDAYYSVVQSLHHAGYEAGAKISIKWIGSETITGQNAQEILSDAEGIIVPGGFGERGIQGMIDACRYARENNIPYFGISLGMQIGIIEYARNVMKLSSANSTEFDNGTADPVVHLSQGDESGSQKSGTMRLGAYPCVTKAGSRIQEIYGEKEVFERHRHRYDFNNNYRESFEKAGMIISGQSPDGRLVEAVELPDMSFYIGVGFHPEFKSRPNRAHPLFREFIKAAMLKKYSVEIDAE